MGNIDLHQTALGANSHTTNIKMSTTVNFLKYQEGMPPLSMMFCEYRLLLQMVGDHCIVLTCSNPHITMIHGYSNGFF